MSNSNHQMVRIDRRQALKIAGTGILTMGFAKMAQATPEAAASAVSKLGPVSTTNSAKVIVDLPEVAENGATVPINIVVDSPMTDADHVKHIHVFAEGNPNPEVISFNLTPASGKADVSTRMRLSQTQNVIVAAVMSDGSVHVNKKEVKVTIGGCGA